MDRGTLHLLCNLHHVIGGTIDLDRIIRKVLAEEDSKPPARTAIKTIRVSHPCDIYNNSIPAQGSSLSVGAPGPCTSLSNTLTCKVVLSSKGIGVDQCSRPNDKIDSTASENANEQRTNYSKHGMERIVPQDRGSVGQCVQPNRASGELFKISYKHRKSCDFQDPYRLGTSFNVKQETPHTSRYHKAEYVTMATGSSNQQEAHSIPNACAVAGQTQDFCTKETVIGNLVRAQYCFDEELTDNNLEEPQPNCSNAYHADLQEHSDNNAVSAKRAILQIIAQKIQQIIRFSKAIPEFSSLSMSDRLNLIKASKSEGSTIGSAAINLKKKRVRVTSKRELSFHELEKIIPGDYMEKRYQIVSELDVLGLSERETAVLRAMVITYPDRGELQDKARVTQIHAQMTACLMHVIDQSHCLDTPKRLEKINHVLGLLRELTETHSNILERVFEKWSMLDDFGIVKEFLNL